MFQHASQKYAAGRTGTLAALGLGLILSPCQRAPKSGQ